MVLDALMPPPNRTTSTSRRLDRALRGRGPPIDTSDLTNAEARLLMGEQAAAHKRRARQTRAVEEASRAGAPIPHPCEEGPSLDGGIGGGLRTPVIFASNSWMGPGGRIP